MYRQSKNSVRFGFPTEVPAKAGVWGWVQNCIRGQGREERRSDLKIWIKNTGT